MRSVLVKEPTPFQQELKKLFEEYNVLDVWCTHPCSYDVPSRLFYMRVATLETGAVLKKLWSIIDQYVSHLVTFQCSVEDSEWNPKYIDQPLYMYYSDGDFIKWVEDIDPRARYLEEMRNIFEKWGAETVYKRGDTYLVLGENAETNKMFIQTSILSVAYGYDVPNIQRIYPPFKQVNCILVYSKTPTIEEDFRSELQDVLTYCGAFNVVRRDDNEAVQTLYIPHVELTNVFMISIYECLAKYGMQNKYVFVYDKDAFFSDAESVAMFDCGELRLGKE